MLGCVTMLVNCRVQPCVSPRSLQLSSFDRTKTEISPVRFSCKLSRFFAAGTKLDINNNV